MFGSAAAAEPLEARPRLLVELVSSDAALRGTAGAGVQGRSSKGFVAGLESPRLGEGGRTRLRDVLDEETRARLERLRRGG